MESDMNTTLDDLRVVLFDTLRGLQKKENPTPIEEATATVHVAQAIISAGRLEIDYIKMRKNAEDCKSQFFASVVGEQPEKEKTTASIEERKTGSGNETSLTVAGGRVMQHRMR